MDESGDYSLLDQDEYIAPSQVWSYAAGNPGDFYATNISGAQRQANGNTLICDGPSGVFFEVNEDNETVWQYINPVTGNARSPKATMSAVARSIKITMFFAARVTHRMIQHFRIKT